MKKLLLVLLLCMSGTIVASDVQAQTTDKKKGDLQWPSAVVLQAAENAVNTSSAFPLGTYDYYYFTFTFKKGVWETFVEYYSYSDNPQGRSGTEWFYFKNNGTQVFTVTKQ